MQQRASDPLSSSQLESDAFKVYCYKIVPCAKKFGHDWSECPFAHEGEKATRRCPALYLYSSIVCPDVRQSKPCPRGDVCPYSHSIFEYWMHPARFRAQMCSFGAECNRRICFFAHAQEQLRVPSEPVVADALATRAPYLQGRVCPKSRYALYPEQVPALIPLHGVAVPQQAVLAQPELAAAGQPIPQLLFVPAAGDGAQGGIAVGPAAGGQLAAVQQQQQQWSGAGSNVMFVPAGPAGANPSLGYYVAAPAGGAEGSTMQGGAVVQQFSAAMVMPAQPLQVAGPPGGTYSNSQVQLVAAVGPGGTISQYPVAAGGMAGAAVAFAPPMYSPGLPSASVPMQPWTMQQPALQQQRQQQQPGSQQQLQLVPVAKGEGMGQAQEGFILTQPPFSAAPPRSLGAAGAMDAPSYAMLTPSGAVVPAPVVSMPPSAAAPGAGDGGGNHVDDITQQMGGWHIA